ncbi:MAG TPA: DUF1643 domain-containing protein [Alphaproteobacteria bacterium]|nr:DUF1643 domain-containing protein [Alphaproteobacteria bacterium]
MFRETAIERSADISRCGRYRWWLKREWGAGPDILWVMLNPARADDSRDDPTVKRVIHFSRSWGFGAATVVNLYPFRTTLPVECRAWAVSDPAALNRIRQNDRAIAELAVSATAVIAAWGTVPWAQLRAKHVASKLARIGVPPLQCLGKTADGSPLHPMARGRMRVADDRQSTTWTA